MGIWDRLTGALFADAKNLGGSAYDAGAETLRGVGVMASETADAADKWRVEKTEQVKGVVNSAITGGQILAQHVVHEGSQLAQDAVKGHETLVNKMGRVADAAVGGVAGAVLPNVLQGSETGKVVSETYNDAKQFLGDVTQGAAIMATDGIKGTESLTNSAINFGANTTRTVTNAGIDAASVGTKVAVKYATPVGIAVTTAATINEATSPKIEQKTPAPALTQPEPVQPYYEPNTLENLKQGFAAAARAAGDMADKAMGAIKTTQIAMNTKVTDEQLHEQRKAEGRLSDINTVVIDSAKTDFTVAADKKAKTFLVKHTDTKDTVMRDAAVKGNNAEFKLGQNDHVVQTVDKLGADTTIKVTGKGQLGLAVPKGSHYEVAQTRDGVDVTIDNQGKKQVVHVVGTDMEHVDIAVLNRDAGPEVKVGNKTQKTGSLSNFVTAEQIQNKQTEVQYAAMNRQPPAPGVEATAQLQNARENHRRGMAGAAIDNIDMNVPTEKRLHELEPSKMADIQKQVTGLNPTSYQMAAADHQLKQAPPSPGKGASPDQGVAKK